MQSLLRLFVIVSMSFLATTVAASSFIIGPLSLAVKVGDADLRSAATIKLDADFAPTTAKIHFRISAKLSISDIEKLIRARILQIGYVDLNLCRVDVTDVPAISLSNVAHTARVNATLSLGGSCPFGPTKALVDVALAPKVDKGGVLRANLGAVSVHLVGGVGPIFDNRATSGLRSRLRDAIKTFAWTPPKTDYGIFALQGARVDKVDQSVVELTVLADGAMNSEQATKLVSSFLPAKPLEIVQ